MWTHPRLSPKWLRGAVPDGIRYAHQKMRGHRLTVFKQRSGELVGVSRNNIRMDFPGWCWWEVMQSKLPASSSVDGELYVPLGSESDVRTAVNKRDPILRFGVFAVPYYAGTARYKAGLEWVEDTCAYVGMNMIDWGFYDPSVDYAQVATRMNIEGFVLKAANYVDWWKIKPIRHIHLAVTGWRRGRGKYEGVVGSIKGSVIHNDRLIEVASVSGMTDAQRAAFSIERDRGKVMMVAYDGIGRRRLRFPRFEEWLPDGPADSHQDVELLEALQR